MLALLTPVLALAPTQNPAADAKGHGSAAGIRDGMVTAIITPGGIGGSGKLSTIVRAQAKREVAKKVEKVLNKVNDKKSRNQPKSEGTPNSSSIDAKDASGKTTKYTEYDGNGKIVKQVEADRGAARHGVEGATKKTPTTNTNPKTGEQKQGKMKIESATKQETPPGNNVKVPQI